MPGKRITDHQVTKYKRLRVNYSQEAAAAKTGISVASARRIESMAALPSQRPPRNGERDPIRWPTCAAGGHQPKRPKSATFSARAVSVLRLSCG